MDLHNDKPNYHLMREEDLDLYLKALEKRKLPYSAEKIRSEYQTGVPDIEATANIKRLEKMQWEAIQGYHNNVSINEHTND